MAIKTKKNDQIDVPIAEKILELEYGSREIRIDKITTVKPTIT